MTRVISGQARGRRLRVPPSGTRPTTDRVRESLFASLESRLLASGKSWSQVRVCDVYAGSGAVGLEAWSRGALFVCLIESDRGAVRVIKENVAELGAEQEAKIWARPVEKAFTEPPPGGAFDVIFADPPYDVASEVVAAALQTAQQHGWLAPECVVVVERSSRSADDPLPPDAGFVEVEQRRYGESALWYGRYVVDEGGSR